MYVSMYMIYIYVCVNDACTRIYIHIRRHICVCDRCVHTCIYMTYMCACVNVCIYMCACVNVRMYMCACVNVCIYMYI
jgi:hypothetical protein